MNKEIEIVIMILSYYTYIAKSGDYNDWPYCILKWNGTLV